jgi:ubiquinone/menaquinone biosynthesis C-methylase UbiE
MLMTQGRAGIVQGHDLSAEAIAQASSRYGPLGLRFATADVTRLPVAHQSIDLYVSFETVEHIASDDAYVAEAARVLKPEGRFLCSTPNCRFFHPGARLADKPVNPFHGRE